jgi:hypothetical protein
MDVVRCREVLELPHGHNSHRAIKDRPNTKARARSSGHLGALRLGETPYLGPC